MHNVSKVHNKISCHQHLKNCNDISKFFEILVRTK